MLHSLETYRRWWCSWRTLPVTEWVRGAKFYRGGDYLQAAAQYREGIARLATHPARFSARIDLAFCLFKLGEFAECEENLRYVTLYQPNCREAFVRLARLQLWLGHPIEAAWTIHRALKNNAVDAELVALMVYSLAENAGPLDLLREALDFAKTLSAEDRRHPLLEAGFARLNIASRDFARAAKRLESLVQAAGAPIESLTLFAELLVRLRQPAEARRQLARALALNATHPRVLSLLAETYLCSGDDYNADYACQLATQACQSSGWLSPRELHVLAESYYHCRDKMAALIMASKAKEVGARLMGAYPRVRKLDRLIEALSSQSLA